MEMRIEEKFKALQDEYTYLMGKYQMMQAEYGACLKAEREKIAEDVANKMNYMGSCLNEKNIILGVITGEREYKDSLCYLCKAPDCLSNGSAISKKDYKARLKADMVAMLEDLDLRLAEQYNENKYVLHNDSYNVGIEQAQSLIQERINALKENDEDESC